MGKLLKYIGYAVLIPIAAFFFILIVVGMAPIVACFLLYGLYLKIFTLLRNDPRVGLERLVDRAKVKDTRSIKNAVAYFEMLVDEIAAKSGASVGKLKKSITDPDDEYDPSFNNKLLVYKKVCTSEHAKIEIELRILESTDDEGNVFHASSRDEEDSELADSIDANITLLSQPRHDPFYVRLEYDETGSYFCIGLLQGGGWHNKKTGQIWSHLTQENVWIVRYSQNGRDFGLRRSKGIGVAREKWFDQKITSKT